MFSGLNPIVVVGSINADLVATAALIPLAGQTIAGHDFKVHHGGKGANQAVAAARLGYPVQMIGRVGDDAFGVDLKVGLQEAGVDVAAVTTTEGSSGVALIVVADSGENSIVVVPGANAAVCPDDIDAQIEMIRTAGMVLVQLEISLETVLHLARLCRQLGVPLMLDPAPAATLPPELFALVTWFTPNETEAAFYLNEKSSDVAPDDPASVAQMLLVRGMEGVALKLGARGAFIANRGLIGDLVSSSKVRAVDTTAAGDCFNAAFAVGLMGGKGALASAKFATAAAAISVTRVGAQSSMPTLSEVEAMLRISHETRLHSNPTTADA